MEEYRITMMAGITSKCPGKIVIDFARRKMKTSSERVTIALVLSTRHSRFGCSCFAETRHILDLRFQIPDLFLQVSSQQHSPGQQCSIIAREAQCVNSRCLEFLEIVTGNNIEG
jgi:hypothetical protein